MQFHEVSLEARNLYAAFIETIEEYRPAVWKYCMRLTSNAWDAEDLLQETFMKAFVSLGQIKHPVIPKSYLFRIASNTWIDQHRKAKQGTNRGWHESDEWLEETQNDRRMDVLEGIEVLIDSLSPRHAVVVLLMEVFDFSGREVAEMLQTTNGAVHAMLARARIKLRSASSDEQYEREKAPHVKENMNPLISRYVEAFHQQDTAKLMDLYAEHAEIHFLNAGIVRGRALIKNTYDWSAYPESYRVECRWLWGQPVVLTTAIRGSLQTLWRAQKLEFEDKSLVREKNYFFCKEVMLEIGEYLGIPVDADTQMNYERTWRALRSCPN